MADNKDVEIKIKVDTSDVDKSMKDVSKASDKMAKDVSSDAKQMSKDTDKINKIFKDLQKTLKDSGKEIQNAFKNINTNGFNKTMNDMRNTATKTASTIKQQLQDAFNVKGNVKVSTTTDKSNGASSGNGMANSLAGSAMSGGAIGSQIAKQLAQEMKGMEQTQAQIAKVTDNIKNKFGEVPQSIQENIGGAVNNVYDAINQLNPELVEMAKNLNIDLSDPKELKAIILSTKDEAQEVTQQLERGMKTLARFKEGLSTRGDDISWLEDDIKLQEEEIARYQEQLEQLKETLVAVSTIDFALNVNASEPIAEIDRLLGKFEEIPAVMKKADAQPIVEQFRILQQAMKQLGMDTSIVDDVLIQWDNVCRTGSKGTIELTNSIKQARANMISLSQGTKQLVQEKIRMQQKDAEINKHNNAFVKSLIRAKQSVQDFGNALRQSFSSGLDKVGNVLVNLKNKTEQWSKSHKQATSAIKAANGTLVSSFKSLLMSIAPVLTIFGMFNFLKQSITSFTEMGETASKFNTVFGNMSDQANEWVDTLARKLPVSKSALMENSSNLMAIAKSMGMTTEEAYKMSTAMSELAIDMDSFYNRTDSLEKVRSAMTGEYEPLKQLGIVLSEDAVKAKALAMGLDGASNSSKLLARQALITEQMMASGAMGDAARTAGSLSNQLKMLSYQFQALKIAIGSCFAGLLQVVIPVLNRIVAAATAAFTALANIINSVFGLFGIKVGGGSSSSGGGTIGGAIGGMADSLSGGLSDAAGSAGGVADNLKDGASAAKEIEKHLLGIDQINNISPNKESGSGSGSGLGGSGGSGAGLGGLGGIGDISSSVQEGASAIDLLSRELSNFEKIFIEIFQKLKTGFMVFANGIRDEWAKLKINLERLGDELVNFLTSCWRNGGSDIAIHLGGLVGVIIETFLALANTVTTSVTKLFQHLNPDNNQHVKRFIEAFDEMILAVVHFVDKCDEWFQAFMDNGGQDFLNNMADVCFILSTTLVEAVTDAINGLNEFLSEDDNERVKSFAENLADVSEQLKNIAQWIQDNIGWLSIIVGLLGGIWAGMKLAPAVIGAVTLAMQGWGWIVGIIQGIGGVLSWLWTTILLPLWNTVLVPLGHAIMTGLAAIASFFGVSVGVVVAVIAAVIAIGVLLWKNWDWICEKASELCTNVSEWFKEMWSKLCTWLQDFSKNSKEKWEEIKQAAIDKVGEMWQGIVDWFNDIVDSAITWCSDLWQGIQDGWNTIVEGITGFCTEIWDNLTGWFGDIVGIFTGGWKDSDKETEEGFNNIEETAKTGAEKTKEGILSKIKGVLPNMGTLWNNVKSGASDKWSKIKETVTSWSGKAKDGIKNSLSGVTGNLSTIWGNVKSGATTAWTGIKSSVSSFASGVKDGAKNSLSGVVGNVSTIWGNIKNGVSGAWNGVKSAVSGSVSAVKGQVQTSLSGAITNVSNIWSSISRGVSGAWNGIRSQVQAAVDRVKSVMNFSWSLPKPKIPKFSISGGQAPWGFGGQGKLPSISIRWNKDGGIFSSPTIFNTNKGFQGVGEAGAEAILPLSKFYNELGKQFAKQNKALSKGNNQQPIQVQVVLDGKVIAQSTVNQFKDMNRRGVLDTSWL